MAQPLCFKPGGEPQVLLTRLVSKVVIDVWKPLHGQEFKVREPREPSSFACEGEMGKPFPGRRFAVREPCVPESLVCEK
eukprot:912163-Amphidinium_carterae.1